MCPYLAQYPTNSAHFTTILLVLISSFQRHPPLPPNHCHLPKKTSTSTFLSIKYVFYGLKYLAQYCSNSAHFTTILLVLISSFQRIHHCHPTTATRPPRSP
jgi:hypothetical protein